MMTTVNAKWVAPSEQGLDDGMKGLDYKNPYTERGDEMLHESYRNSYHIGLLHNMKREEFFLLNKNA